ncbi:MAG: outer membrane beta-barrel protein [Pirellulaceae bacterium]|nr:outer membrane beta-barrel protein [Pirellulaceae bacterium]
MAACSFAAGQAAAQGIIQPVPEAQYYVQQDAVQPSPSDLAVPAVTDVNKAKDDTWQKDGGHQKGDCGIGCNGKCGKGAGCCDSLKPFEIYPRDCRGIKIGGWTQFGYHSQDSIADFFNQYEDHLALHQQWMYIEREADGSCGLDWGFRFDMMYGIDANNTQAFGNTPGRWDYADSFQHGEYGWALPQLYLEVAYHDLSVKAGHFYTTIGYEVVPAPDNFFYSHAFTMNNSKPFTHTGVLGTYDWTDRLTLFAGWTLGWDTGFDQFGGGNNWLGGFSYALTDSVDFIYMSTWGDFGAYGGVRTGDDCYSHSIVLDVDITERLNYVFQSDWMKVQDIGIDDGELVSLAGANLETFGINQYLIYTLNDCWAFGARLEWWKPEGESFYNATFGVNYRPHTNVVIRPEIRHEWVPTENYEETIFGIDMVLTY